MLLLVEIEIARRELFPKIFLSRALLGVCSKIIISHRKYLKELIESNNIKNAVLLIKDANPRSDLLEYYRNLKRKGFTIISQDEEAGYIDQSYENFSLNRHAEGETFDIVDYFLCWGKRDKEFLSNRYNKKKCEFINCGSPRLDIYKEDFNVGKNYLKVNDLNKNFILISLNFFCFYNRSFSERISLDAVRLGPKYLKTIGGINYEEHFFKREAETLYLLYEFINLVRFLAKKLPHKIIVIRPHPNFLVDRFKKITKDFPENVKIISNGHLSEVIKNCEVVIQNSCSSAPEAVLAKKKIINYLGGQKFFQTDFVDSLGQNCSNQEEVLEAINRLNIEDSDLGKLEERINFKGLSIITIKNLLKSIKKENKKIESINFKNNLNIKKLLKNVVKKIIRSNRQLDSGTDHVKYKLNEFDNERIKQIVQEINNLENQVFEKKINYNFFEEKFIVIN